MQDSSTAAAAAVEDQATAAAAAEGHEAMPSSGSAVHAARLGCYRTDPFARAVNTPLPIDRTYSWDLKAAQEATVLDEAHKLNAESLLNTGDWLPCCYFG
jgi:hypothetical protein